MYKGHIDKAKGGRFKRRRLGWVGQGAMMVWKWRQLYLNNNNNNKKEWVPWEQGQCIFGVLLLAHCLAQRQSLNIMNKLMNNNQEVDYLLTDIDDQSGYLNMTARGIYHVWNAIYCVKSKYVQSRPSQLQIRPVIICMAWEKRTLLITYYYSSSTTERHTHQEKAKIGKEGGDLEEFEDSQLSTQMGSGCYYFKEVCRNNDYMSN